MENPDSQCAGPLLTDREFFQEALLYDKPEMRPVQRAVERGDYPEARKAFAGAIPKLLKPDVFFSIPYEIPEDIFKLPGEGDKEAADRICRNELVSCGIPCAFGNTIDWFANPTFNGYNEWPLQLNRHEDWKHLAHIYRETGDEKYARCFASQFAGWVKQVTAPPAGTRNNLTLGWRTIECGLRMGHTWPYVLHVFYRNPAFTGDLLVDWYKSVYEQGLRLFRDHSGHGNWFSMEMNGLGQIGILYPELAPAKEWYDYALKKLNEEWDLLFYPDGFHFQLTTEYHFDVINNYHRLIQVMRAYGLPLPEGMIEKLERAAEVYVKLMKPDGRTPDLNDGARQYVSVYLKMLGDIFPDNRVFRWILSGGKEGNKPAYLSIALPWSGFEVMRTGWDKDALWALFDAGPLGCGHEHEDMLNLIVCTGETTALDEGGSYAYDNSEIRGYVISTRAHNTARVDGQDQNRRKNYRWQDDDIQRQSGMKYRNEEAFDFAEGEYRGGYGPEADTSVTHRRGVLFLKEPPAGLGPFFVVIDRFFSAGDKTHHYDILWHFGETPPELGPGRVSAQTITLLHSGKPDAMAVIYGQEHPEWQGWLTGGFGRQGNYYPAHTLVHSLDGGNLRVVTLLYPGKGGACPVTAVEAESRPEDRNILIRYEGRELILNEYDYGC
ncbi:MAG: heparinase II/III family protein [Treponema sp.]|jgi:hypothetical protein|nr:heparinase II/III family protein [Treponema sp.]